MTPSSSGVVAWHSRRRGSPPKARGADLDQPSLPEIISRAFGSARLKSSSSPRGRRGDRDGPQRLEVLPTLEGRELEAVELSCVGDQAPLPGPAEPSHGAGEVGLLPLRPGDGR